MGKFENNFDLELIRSMVAQAAWDLFAHEPADGWLTARVARGIISADTMAEQFKEELLKLL